MKKQKVMQIIFSVLTAALCFMLILDSEGAIKAVRESVTVCLTVIIPSLFAFMVFSQVFIKSGIGDVLFYPLYKLNSFWFRGSRREFSIFMISLFGGYPIGIKLLKEYIAYNKNYSAIAEKMLCYCYCGSPSFIIQIVGLSVFGSAKAGLLVYLSNAAACLTMAVIINICSPKREKEKNVLTASKISLTDFTDSIADTVKALGIICGTILAFNVGIELLRYCGFIDLLKMHKIDGLALSVIEISNLSAYQGNDFTLLPIFSTITSFGGFCIIAQTAALSKGQLSLKGFMLSRLPAAALSGIYMYFFCRAVPFTAEVFNNTAIVASISTVDSLGTICLIIMTYLVLKEFNGIKPAKNSKILTEKDKFV